MMMMMMMMMMITKCYRPTCQFAVYTTDPRHWYLNRVQSGRSQSSNKIRNFITKCYRPTCQYWPSSLVPEHTEWSFIEHTVWRDDILTFHSTKLEKILLLKDALMHKIVITVLYYNHCDVTLTSPTLYIPYFNTCTVRLLLFCTMTNKCTIISQIITLLHVSTLSCHPQRACNQYLAKLHKYQI